MTSAVEGTYAINNEETTAPLNEGYDTVDAETIAPLNEQAQVVDSTKTNGSRCSTRTKFFSVGLLAVAVAAGSLGYYFGIYKKDTVKPKYTYKRVVVSTPDNSTMTPLSLSSNDNECTVSQSSTTVNIVPMPHQIVLCQTQTYCDGNYVLVSLYDYDAYISDAQSLLLYDWSVSGF